MTYWSEERLRRLELYHRDGRQVKRLAEELVSQVAAFERNIRLPQREPEAETLRFVLMENLALQLLKAARRGAKRYRRVRDA